MTLVIKPRINTPTGLRREATPDSPQPKNVARRGARRSAPRVRRARPTRTGRNLDVFGPRLQTYESKIRKQRDYRSRGGRGGRGGREGPGGRGGTTRRTHAGSKIYLDCLANISPCTQGNQALPKEY